MSWSKFVAEIGTLCPHITPAGFDYSVNISAKHGLLFTETPKAGCSTVKATLQRIELNEPDFRHTDWQDTHRRELSPLLKPSQVEGFRSKLPQYFKFCVCRDPFARLLSAYLDKIQGNGPQKKRVLLHLGLPLSDYEYDISFEDFVRVVCEQPISIMDPHWRTQYYQTFQEGVSYDAICRFERLSEDFSAVLEGQGIEWQPYLDSEHRHKTSASDKLGDYYTPALKSRVREKFDIDFQFFGYT